ncbi:MAG: alpha/beta hydrolase-fold protein [Candidatus Dependentiae bacterium]
MNKKALLLCLLQITFVQAVSLLQYKSFLPASNVGPSSNNPFEYHRLERVDPFRSFEVYLPEAYSAPGNENTNFPVWYWLHGFGQNFSSYAGMFEILDQLMASGDLPPMIIVKVDGSLSTSTSGELDNGYAGSFYINSAFNGNFEDYFINEVIPFVDSNYRTIANKANRGIAGHEMGGYGAVILGFKHTDLFSSIVAHTPADVVAMADTIIKPSFYSRVWDEIPATGDDAGRVLPSNGGYTFELFAESAALSPDLLNTFSLQLPIVVDDEWRPVLTNGEFTINSDVVEQWLENDPVTMIRNDAALREALKDIKIYIDYGKPEDQTSSNGAIRLSQELSCKDIPHETVVFSGTSFPQRCALTPSNNLLLQFVFPALQRSAEVVSGQGLQSIPFLIDLIVRALDIPFDDYNSISINRTNIGSFINNFCAGVPATDIRDILINPDFRTCLQDNGVDPDTFNIDYFVLNQVLQFNPPQFNIVSDGFAKPLCSACKLFLPLPC